jgi:hypothetical protein
MNRGPTSPQIVIARKRRVIPIASNGSFPFYHASEAPKRARMHLPGTDNSPPSNLLRNNDNNFDYDTIKYVSSQPSYSNNMHSFPHNQAMTYLPHSNVLRRPFSDGHRCLDPNHTLVPDGRHHFDPNHTLKYGRPQGYYLSTNPHHHQDIQEYATMEYDTMEYVCSQTTPHAHVITTTTKPVCTHRSRTIHTFPTPPLRIIALCLPILIHLISVSLMI